MKRNLDLFARRIDGIFGFGKLEVIEDRVTESQELQGEGSSKTPETSPAPSHKARSIFFLLYTCLWRKPTPNKPNNFLTKKISKMYREQKWYSLTVLLDIAYLKTMTFTFLQLKYPVLDRTEDKISMFLALCYLIVFSYYPIWMYKLVSQDFTKTIGNNPDRQREFYHTYGGIWEIYKDSALFEVVGLARKWIFSVIVVFFTIHPVF